MPGDRAEQDRVNLAYEMGRDCAIRGPNGSNCDFRMFATPERTKAWERGKAEDHSLDLMVECVDVDGIHHKTIQVKIPASILKRSLKRMAAKK